MTFNLFNQSNLEFLKSQPDNSIDSIVTDPPYGISFMGKSWDYDVPNTDTWKELMRVLKPGGHIIVACGTRTQHRMAVNIEDAGFEIRDIVSYMYGSGFPKSHNIWKSLKKKCECGILEEYEKSRNEQRVSLQQEAEYNLRFMRDRNISPTINTEKEQGKVLQSSLSEQSSHRTMQGNKSEEGFENGKESNVEGGNNLQKTERELQGCEVCEMSEKVSKNGEKGRLHNGTQTSNGEILEQTTDENRGGSSHRPQPEQQQDREPCAFCKQHLAQALGTYGFGTALKPAMELWTMARKPLSEKNVASNVLKWGTGGINIDGSRVEVSDNEKESFAKEWDRFQSEAIDGNVQYVKQDKSYDLNQNRPTGRFPANVIHDGSDDVTDLFPNSKSTAQPRNNKNKGKNYNCFNEYNDYVSLGYDDSGSASRFFYCAKASKSERNAGLDGFEDRYLDIGDERPSGGSWERRTGQKPSLTKNHHPTVKPVALMRYLARLITPKNGVVLDPYMGSGSTGIACVQEGFNFIGVEMDKEYFEIAKARIEHWTKQ